MDEESVRERERERGREGGRERESEREREREEGTTIVEQLCIRTPKLRDMRTPHRHIINISPGTRAIGSKTTMLYEREQVWGL
jgi:hypothetical protein